MAYYETGTYSAWDEYNTNEKVRTVLNQLIDGTYGDFRSLYDYLLQANDEFFILKDFNAYDAARSDVMKRFHDKKGWARTAAMNVAYSGRFSSDRTIDEYARDIWDIKPLIIS